MGLDLTKIQYVVKKGLSLFVDSYSAFCDNGGQNETALNEHLRSRNVKRVVIMGIATDYCVKQTALGALARGYEVTLVVDGCRGVTGQTSQQAITEMEAWGVSIATSDEVLAQRSFSGEG